MTTPEPAESASCNRESGCVQHMDMPAVVTHEWIISGKIRYDAHWIDSEGQRHCTPETYATRKDARSAARSLLQSGHIAQAHGRVGESEATE